MLNILNIGKIWKIISGYFGPELSSTRYASCAPVLDARALHRVQLYT